MAVTRRYSCRTSGEDLTIDGHTEAGQQVLIYSAYRCWASEYQELPELDANANAVAQRALEGRTVLAKKNEPRADEV